MILLVTPSERAPECAVALTGATGQRVVTAESLSRAATLLRAECCVAVILDQHLLEAEPREAKTILEHLGAAVPVQVNLAISGMERLVREVQAAMQRRRIEEAQARQAAIGEIRSELNDTVTALLLASDLSLETANLSAEAAEKLGSVRQLAEILRRQLEGGCRGALGLR